MADIHVLKLTEQEAVLKIYSTEASGTTMNIALSTLTRANEVFVNGTSGVSIKAMYWGLKQNKQLDVGRIVNGSIEGHYYLANSGFYQYQGFTDTAYDHNDIRIVADGPFHLIVHLTKYGWQNKLEPETFGPYDNPNVVGA
jgi:hypothetical protein